MNESQTFSMPAIRLQFVARCADILAKLCSSADGITSATVATTDGLTVASTLENQHEIDRLAAVSGSLGGLAAALARESGHGDMRQIVLDGETGRIIALAVPQASMPLYLTIVADGHAVLGTLLWAGRLAAEQVARASTETEAAAPAVRAPLPALPALNGAPPRSPGTTTNWRAQWP